MFCALAWEYVSMISALELKERFTQQMAQLLREQHEEWTGLVGGTYFGTCKGCGGGFRDLEKVGGLCEGCWWENTTEDHNGVQ
jgi:hypothetical protein